MTLSRFEVGGQRATYLGSMLFSRFCSGVRSVLSFSKYILILLIFSKISLVVYGLTLSVSCILKAPFCVSQDCIAEYTANHQWSHLRSLRLAPVTALSVRRVPDRSLRSRHEALGSGRILPASGQGLATVLQANGEASARDGADRNTAIGCCC